MRKHSFVLKWEKIFAFFDVIKIHIDVTGGWLNHMQLLLHGMWREWINGCRKNRVNFSIFVAVRVHSHILIKAHINEKPHLFIYSWHFCIFLMRYMIVPPSPLLRHVYWCLSVCMPIHAYKELIHCLIDIFHLEKEKALKHFKSNCWLSEDEQKIWREQQNELLGTSNHFCYLLEAFCSANISE